MSKLTFLFVFLLASSQIWGQFEDLTIQMGTPTITDDPWFGHGVSLIDVNQDGWDDVTFCTFFNGIFIYENTAGNGWIRRNVISYPGNAKCAVYADYDRDGDLDMFVTYRMDQMKLFQNNGNWNFIDVSQQAGLENFPIVNTWGAAWEDFNVDGWPDLFVVNYDATAGALNRLLKNNGNGTFSDVASEYGVQGGGTFPFMPVFFDANSDYRNDLLVAVDYLPGDLLFLKNDTGGFDNVSDSCGLNFMLNSMTCSPGDYDNDGDFDLFLTNTPGAGSMLYLNNDSAFFYDATAQNHAQINAWNWGAVWCDLNNDMRLDLITTSQFYLGSSSIYVLKNTGDSLQNITQIDLQFLPNSNYALATGDINRDGKVDFAVNVEDGGYNRVYKNIDANENHSLKIELEGTVSNLNGFGTIVSAYSNGIEIKRQLRGGEQYLSQNSQHIIIPMGVNTVADSIVLSWPSGVREVYRNVQADYHYHFQEGDMSPKQIFCPASEICSGDSTTIYSVNNETIYWSNGEVGNSVQVHSGGNYYGYYLDSRNIVWFTDTVFVQENLVEVEIDTAAWIGLYPVELFAIVNSGTPPFNFQWSNGCVTSFCEFQESSDVSLLVQDSTGCSGYANYVLPVAVWEESEIFYVVEDNCVRFEEPVEVEVYNSLGQLIESCTTKELILNRKGVSFICFRRASYSWKVFPIIRF